jgi:hypothetical protein
MLTSAQLSGNPRKRPCISVDAVRREEFAARWRRPRKVKNNSSYIQNLRP